MKYRTILLRNGEYKKTLHRSVTKETAFVHYRGFKEKSDKVFFEKKFINTKGIKPVKYEILIVKNYEVGDVVRKIKGKDGELVDEKPIFGIWTVLDSYPYRVEEDFSVYGFCSKTERKNIADIIRILLKKMNIEYNSKEVIVVYNKLVIYNEEQFDMVICKNKKDAQRLHHTLYDATRGLKIKNLLFMGTCSTSNISMLYDIIHEHTDWPFTKIRRTSTRP
jgi:hypothetical protein